MFTGQISSHALHDVHAHSSSDVTRSNTESAVMVMSCCTPTGGDTTGSPVAAITSPTFSTISRVERLAGRVRGAHRRAAPAHRARVGVEQLLPGEVLDGRRTERLELGLHEVGHRLHRALRAVRSSLQVHVHRRRDHVAQLRGGQDHEEGHERSEVHDPQRPVGVLGARRPTTSRTATRAGSRRTTTPRTPGGRPSAMRSASVKNPVTAITRNVIEDHGVLGLGLDADPVRPLDVAAADGPHDPGGEHDTDRDRRRRRTPGRCRRGGT